MPAVLVPHRRRRSARAKWRAAGVPATAPCGPDPLEVRPRALQQTDLFHACRSGEVEGQSALLLGELGDQAGVMFGASLAPDGGKPELWTIAILVIRPAEMGEIAVWSTADFALASHGPAARVPAAEELLLRETQSYLRSLLSSGADPNALAADDRAWREFYGRYDPLIHRSVRSERIRAADVDDCVQEVWTHLIQRLPLFDPDPQEGSFAAWLALVARRKAIDFRRKLEAARKRMQHLEAPIASPDSDPAALHARQERAAMVRDAFAAIRGRLSPTSYQVLRLRWVEEKDPAQIALGLSLTPQQVWFRLTRAKKKLRRLLKILLPETAYDCVE